jgi:cyclase
MLEYLGAEEPMRRKLLALRVAVALLVAVRPGLADNAPGPTVEVAPGLFAVVWPEDGGNVAFLVTEEGVLVVDTGASAEQAGTILARIREKTDRPIRYILLTHYHDDHTNGLASFPSSATVVAHHDLAANLAKSTAADLEAYPAHIARREKLVRDLAKEGGDKLKQAQDRLAASRRAYEALKAARPVVPTITFASTLTIRLGKEIIELHHLGPTHTTCSSVVYFPQQKAVHMGDQVFASAHPYIDGRAGADTERWVASLKAAEAWGVERVIPGHGPVGGREELTTQIGYLEDLRQEVRAAISRDLSAADARKSVTMEAYKGYRWADLVPNSVEVVHRELTAQGPK